MRNWGRAPVPIFPAMINLRLTNREIAGKAGRKKRDKTEKSAREDSNPWRFLYLFFVWGCFIWDNSGGISMQLLQRLGIDLLTLFIQK